MTFLSLFSGIGAMDLGLERAGMRCVGQVEIDPFCRAVLAKHWPGVFRWDDVKTFDCQRFVGVDVVAGGFPCQDISAAGKGAGIDGARSGLWSQMRRVIGLFRPRWVLTENVPALRTRGADRVLGDLEAAGYACRAVVVGAEHVGAPHKRQRVWIVANAAWDGQRKQPSPQWPDRERTGAAGDELEHADGNAIREQWGCAGGNGAAATIAGGAGDELADAASGGLRADGGTRGNAGHTDECGADLADASGAGCEERHASAISGEPQGRDASEHFIANEWPVRPGERQHEWEAARLVEFPLGGAIDGASARLVRAANRNALKALGNAVVWQIPWLIGRWMMAQEGEGA